jgi:hypothetical protein
MMNSPPKGLDDCLASSAALAIPDFSPPDARAGAALSLFIRSNLEVFLGFRSFVSYAGLTPSGTPTRCEQCGQHANLTKTRYVEMHMPHRCFPRWLLAGLRIRGRSFRDFSRSAGVLTPGVLSADYIFRFESTGVQKGAHGPTWPISRPSTREQGTSQHS